MKILGLICEYNPFHQGHIHHLKQSIQTVKPDVTVVITSSYFTSRGLPSLLCASDKAHLALEHGADLVIELPACYAMQSADYFAKYAIQSLSTLGVDTICFGSETNDIETLKSYLPLLDDFKIDPSLSLISNASKYIPALLPNDILGLQYLRYCKEMNIQAVSIPRDPSFKSATQTRQDYFLGSNQDFSEYFCPHQNWDSYYLYLRTFLMMSPPELLSSFFLMEEGIEYRLIEQAKIHKNYADFLSGCISKTYTRARIQRTCLFAMLQIKKQDMKENDSFYSVHVLGFNKKGRKLLKQHKNAPIATKFNQKSPFLQQIDLKSRQLYQSVNLDMTLKTKVIYYDR